MSSDTGTSGRRGSTVVAEPASAPLVLSLFPGIGLLDMAFEEEGFTVVRGPDVLWGGDVRRFHPPAGKFDGVIGGPPCQAFSRLRHIVRANGYETAPNLIPEFERVVGEASPSWFVMENVPDAPLPSVQGFGMCDRLVRDVAVGGQTSRTRRFSFGLRGMSNLSARLMFRIEVLPLFTPTPLPAVTCDSRDTPVAIGRGGKRKARRGNGGAAPHEGPRLSAAEMLRRQGFPDDLLDGCPLTDSGKRTAIGNGVPLPMGRAIARAVKAALSARQEATA